MLVTWGDLNLTNLISAFSATAIGVYLGFLVNSLRESTNRNRKQKQLIHAVTQEVFSVIADFQIIRNGIASGSLPKALNIEPHEAVRLNIPNKPVLLPKLLEEGKFGKGNLTPMLTLLRSWSNSERLYRAIEKMEKAQTSVIVSMLDSILGEYAKLTWNLRSIYMGATSEFNQELWLSLVNRANRNNNRRFRESCGSDLRAFGAA
jgi:hypothetical protein